MPKMSEEKEARIKRESTRMMRKYNEQGFAYPDGCSARHYISVVRDIIRKNVTNTLKKRKWEKLTERDLYFILHKVNNEVDEWFDWK